MNEGQVYEALTEIFRDVIGDDAISITPQTTARDVRGWDSFAHINIVVASETAFCVKFRTTELEQLHNVGDFVSLILDKRKTH